MITGILIGIVASAILAIFLKISTGKKPAEPAKVEIKLEPVHDQPTAKLIKRIRDKYGAVDLEGVWYTLLLIIITIVALSIAASAKGEIAMDQEDYDEIMEALSALARIEAAEPKVQVENISLNKYGDYQVTGTVEIATLKYRLSTNIQPAKTSRPKKYRLASLSALNCGENNWGIAASLEIWKIKPTIYGLKESFGAGLQLPIYGNLSALLGADYPGFSPRYGFIFKIKQF
jgi:hypothetical protein